MIRSPLLIPFSFTPRFGVGKDPEVICSSPQYKELKWIAGEFYWMESVQSYNEGGWDYTTELHKFVQGGMSGTSFIDAVSGIVNRGCHNPVSRLGVLFLYSPYSDAAALLPPSCSCWRTAATASSSTCYCRGRRKRATSALAFCCWRRRATVWWACCLHAG